MDEDPLYIDAARTLVTSSNRFDVVVFGHTHLPKRIPLGGHGQLYLNTGTWCEVLRLPEQALKDDQSGLTSLQEFIDAMKRNLFEKFLHRQLTFAEILVEDDGKATNADLWRFGGRGAERVSI